MSEFHGMTEDEILVLLEGGKSISEISRELGIHRATLSRWLRDNPQRSARAREARELSAEAYEEKAELEIREAADMFELSKAKELAHHLRWRASKLAPKKYGDKISQEISGPDGGAVQVSRIELVALGDK